MDDLDSVTQQNNPYLWVAKQAMAFKNGPRCPDLGDGWVPVGWNSTCAFYLKVIDGIVHFGGVEMDPEGSDGWEIHDPQVLTDTSYVGHW